MKKLLLILALTVSIVGWELNAEAADGFSLSGFNLQGDTAYLVVANEFAVGVGIDIASIYEGMITVRAEALTPQSGALVVGAGIMANVPKVINKLGGSWISSTINPSVGVVPVYDFNNKVFDVGIVLAVINIKF